MNADLRKEIESAVSLINEAKSNLESVKDEEQEYFDSMSEAFQQDDRGQTVEQAINYLDEAVGSLYAAISSAESAL